jgi:hypothetical protein
MKSKKTKGNGPGKGMKAVSTAVPEPIYSKMQELASRSDMTCGKWAKEVLTRAARRNEVFVLHPIDFSQEFKAVAETPDQYPGKPIDPSQHSAGGASKAPDQAKRAQA